MNFEIKYRSDGSWYVVVPQPTPMMPLQPPLSPLQSVGRALRKVPERKVEVIKS